MENRCQQCGAPIHPQTGVCPVCGKSEQPVWKGLLIAFLIVVVLLGIILSVVYLPRWLGNEEVVQKGEGLFGSLTEQQTPSKQMVSSTVELSSQTVSAVSVSSTPANPTALRANGQDVKNFDELVEEMYYGWPFEKDTQEKKVEFSALSVKDAIEDYVYCVSGHSLYPYYKERFFDNKEENYVFVPDPKGKFYDSARLDADDVDWMLEKVLGITPDRTQTSDAYYYHGDKLYRSTGGVGGPGNLYKRKDRQDLGKGRYGFAYSVYDEMDNSFWGTYYFVAQLQEDPDYGRYWKLIRASKDTPCYE